MLILTTGSGSDVRPPDNGARAGRAGGQLLPPRDRRERSAPREAPHAPRPPPEEESEAAPGGRAVLRPDQLHARDVHGVAVQSQVQHHHPRAIPPLGGHHREGKRNAGSGRGPCGYSYSTHTIISCFWASLNPLSVLHQQLGRSEVKITSRLVIAGMGMAEEDEAGPSWGDVEQLWAGTVTTLVRTGPEEHVRSLKWVVIVGSILAGLLLLALLSAILWAVSVAKTRSFRVWITTLVCWIIFPHAADTRILISPLFPPPVGLLQEEAASGQVGLRAPQRQRLLQQRQVVRVAAPAERNPGRSDSSCPRRLVHHWRAACRVMCS